MKLKKILLASATVAAFSAVMSISALATETKLNEITYIPANGNNPAYVKVADAPVFTDGSSYTMLILNTNNGAVLTTIANTDIKQIGEESVTYKDVEIPVGDLTAGATYEVRMGGDGNLWTGTFPVPKTEEEKPYTDGTRLIGDIYKDSVINLTDALQVIDKVAGSVVLTGDDLLVADVNDDTAANLTDCLEIIQYKVGGTSVVDGKKTLSQKTNFNVK